MDQKRVKVQFKVMLPKDVEQRFREAAMKRFEYRKGALGKAAEHALSEWTGSVEDKERRRQEIGDPVKAIRGILKHVNMSSVDLQHSISKIRTERYVSHRRKHLS